MLAHALCAARVEGDGEHEHVTAAENAHATETGGASEIEAGGFAG